MCSMYEKIQQCSKTSSNTRLLLYSQNYHRKHGAYSSFRRAKTTFKRYIPAIGVRLEYSVNKNSSFSKRDNSLVLWSKFMFKVLLRRANIPEFTDVILF